jgi:hypothetical protein
MYFMAVVAHLPLIECYISTTYLSLASSFEEIFIVTECVL